MQKTIYLQSWLFNRNFQSYDQVFQSVEKNINRKIYDRFVTEREPC